MTLRTSARTMGLVLVMAVLAGCGGGRSTETVQAQSSQGSEATTETDTATSEPPAAEASPPAEGETPAGGTGDGTSSGTTNTAAGTTTAPAGDGAATAAGTTTAAAAGGSDAPMTQADWQARVRRGRQRFDAVCGTCHPGGDEDIGPRIIGVGLTVDRMQHQIRQGSGRMRPISAARLSDRDMEAMMAYLSTIRAVRGVARPE